MPKTTAISFVPDFHFPGSKRSVSVSQSLQRLLSPPTILLSSRGSPLPRSPSPAVPLSSTVPLPSRGSPLIPRLPLISRFPSHPAVPVSSRGPLSPCGSLLLARLPSPPAVPLPLTPQHCTARATGLPAMAYELRMNPIDIALIVRSH